jgi:hypothetical protein
MNSPHYEIGEAVLYQKLEDEVVLLNMATEQYYGLDDVGAHMWRLLLEAGDPESVADRLSRYYAAERDMIRQDVDELARHLLAAGLLKTSERPPALRDGVLHETTVLPSQEAM